MAPSEDVAPETRSPEEWGALYAARRGHYEDYTRRLYTLVVDLLRAADIDVIQVEARTKDVGSFIEKITRKRRENSDPFVSITDLVGLRVITYYLDDVARVGDILQAEFEIDADKSMDKSQSLASDQFGYRSSHYVGKIRDPRAKLIEWSPFKDLIVEVQVRTALQHAWAAVNHKLQYKSPDEAPAALGRRLYRLSALFELADEQFAVLRDVSKATDVAYRDEVGEGRLDVPIDASSVPAYLNVSPRMKALRDLLQEAGFRTNEAGAELPAERLARDRSDLVAVLRQYGFQTLADLDAYLSDIPRLKVLAAADFESTSPGDRDGSAEDLLTQLIIIDRDTSGRPGASYYLDEAVSGFLAARELAAERLTRK